MEEYYETISQLSYSFIRFLADFHYSQMLEFASCKNFYREFVYIVAGLGSSPDGGKMYAHTLATLRNQRNHPIRDKLRPISSND